MGDAPQSTLPYPPLHKDKTFVVLSDWCIRNLQIYPPKHGTNLADGSGTAQSPHLTPMIAPVQDMTDNLGFGKAKRREGNLEILSGRVTFRDAFREMLESVSERHKFAECQEILKQNIQLDAGFREFYEWCKENDVPVVIVSSGMAPLIRAVLSNLIGEEEASRIDVVANDVKVEADGSWAIQYRHPTSGFGHDKSQAILPYRDLPEPPTLFFFGDGVSDMSAASHADILFVKKKDDGENDLAAYCTREGIRHIIFDDFKKALPVVQSVVLGKRTVAQALSLERV